MDNKQAKECRSIQVIILHSMHHAFDFFAIFTRYRKSSGLKPYKEKNNRSSYQ
jgi:hypothetical protein